jgi:hypothetical protein
MSAFGRKEDILSSNRNVRFGPKADINDLLGNLSEL